MGGMKTIVNELRDELRVAHIIIRSALSVATFDQKMEWANMNERDAVIGEGITRANERQAAIDGGSVDALYRELKCADRIIANARSLLSDHQFELWTVAIRFAGVMSQNVVRDDVRRRLLTRAVLTCGGNSAADGVAAYQLVAEALVYGGESWIERVRAQRARAREFEDVLMRLRSSNVWKDLVRVVEQFADDAVHHLNAEQRRLLREFITECLKGFDKSFEAGVVSDRVAEKDGDNARNDLAGHEKTGVRELLHVLDSCG
ncbi:hypothetical protein [Burkholderia pseudomallei]|uniref:hypothetical protein n=1 Tax=Burkholderia pseudomallei TaxID=28450 RepID=UPI000F04BCE8|nr:hypothetical protein [Burkholderia pseudomallei]